VTVPLAVATLSPSVLLSIGYVIGLFTVTAVCVGGAAYRERRHG